MMASHSRAPQTYLVQFVAADWTPPAGRDWIEYTDDGPGSR